MKKIKYAIPGYTSVFNQNTEEVEKIECISYCIVDYSAKAEEQAKEKAYKGDYEIFDDGEPEPVVEPTTEDVLNALLGVM